MADNVNQFDNSGGSGNGGSGSGGGPGGPGGSGGDPRKQSLIMLVAAALITLLCVSVFMKMLTGATNQEISYNEFVKMVEDGKVKSVQVGSDRITVYPKAEQKDSAFLYAYGMGASTYYTGKMEDDDKLAERLLKHNVEMKAGLWAWARARRRLMCRRRRASPSRMWPGRMRQKNLWWKW